MPAKRYVLTNDDRDVLSALVLDLATELDLHYDHEDFHALTQSFDIIKRSIALLQRAGCQLHPDVHSIVARYDKFNQ